jgi:nucleoside-diphosphate-sugar epimerase
VIQQPILVLGANGFIGREVVRGLASTDWAIPIRGVRAAPTAAKDSLEERPVEATQVDSLRTAMRGVAGVVNCVAADAARIVLNASALFDAAKTLTHPPRIIHLSTMSVYGSTIGLVDESAPLRGDLGPYSEAKVAAEKVASTYPHSVIFRPGCVFGPGSQQWSIRFAHLLLAHRLGDLGAAGDGCCNLVHVGDVALAVVRSLEDPRTDGRVFNLATPTPPTWNEFLIKYAIALRAVPVSRISGRRLRIEGKILAPPLKIAEILARICKLDAGRIPPPIPPSLIRLMGQDIRLDPRRAESELGLRFRDTQAALEETARWFKERSVAP